MASPFGRRAQDFYATNFLLPEEGEISFAYP